MSSTSFVVQWHCNDQEAVSSSQSTQSKADAKPGQPSQEESTEIADRNVPTHAVFRCLHSTRSALLRRIDSIPSQDLHPVLDAIAGVALRRTAIATEESGVRRAVSSSEGWGHVKRKPLQCSKVIESQHPYRPEQDVFWTVEFPGAAHIVVCACILGRMRETKHVWWPARL